jgi:putative membrane protein
MMEIDWNRFALQLLSTITFTLIGFVLFAGAFLFLSKVVKFPIRKEIEEDQNIALAILIGSAILGFAWIVAAAVHG